MSDMYRRSPGQVLDEFGTDIGQGLTDEEVKKQREKYGLNELEEQESRSPWEILLSHLNNIIVYLLGAAMILSILMGDWIEALAIAIAVLISVSTGFFAEYSAQQSAEALQDLVDTKARVLREGQKESIPSIELVPGDILILSEGDAISADGRLLETNNFSVMEASLTGESESVEKDAQAEVEEGAGIGDRINMVFSGTAVTRGRAKAIITGTGMDTEVGKISGMLDGDESHETPLDKEIAQLGRALITVAFAAALLVFIIGLINGQDWSIMLHIAIILAVAAIPEAMPAVETITLSNGMNTMAEHNALVKQLNSVETLGSTSVIASDKTGTLTENQMTVTHIYLADDRLYEVTGQGYEPKGEISLQGQDERLDGQINEAGNLDFEEEHADLFRAVLDGLFASEAKLLVPEADKDLPDDDEEVAEEKREYDIDGDPTDGALTVLGYKLGLSDEGLAQAGYEKLATLPFDSDRKYMAAVLEDPHEDKHVIVKGAPDVLLDLTEIEGEERADWERRNQDLAENGRRVIALARLNLNQADMDLLLDDIEAYLEEHSQELEIVAVFGIMDPARKDVPDAIDMTQKAGIKVVMITGDHPDTASYIAEEIGIEHADQTMTGKEIDEKADDANFKNFIQEIGVFARVSPENKRQITDAFQEAGEVVAMTGDGVNDAPALSGADIGIAMGIRGTEVAKESAHMILTDDRFSTIVEAVRVGRIIFENIKKYVSFLFACNMVEITTILVTTLLTLPMPLQPLHVLFLNLVIDVGPALALAYEPAEGDIMNRPPRDKNDGLVNPIFLSRIIISGIVLGLASFVIFYYFHEVQARALAYSQTATFAFMALAQLLHIFNVRKTDSFGLDRSFFKNRVLLATLFFSLMLLLAAVYLPFMNTILGTVPLDGQVWVIMLLGVAVATLLVYLLKKLFTNK